MKNACTQAVCWLKVIVWILCVWNCFRNFISMSRSARRSEKLQFARFFIILHVVKDLLHALVGAVVYSYIAEEGRVYSGWTINQDTASVHCNVSI